MKVWIFLSLFSCLMYSQAWVIVDDESNVIEMDTEVEDVSELTHRRGHGHCICCPHGCWCHGRDAGVSVQATLTVKEFSQNLKTEIDALFKIDKTVFMKTFPVNKLEDFCETVDGKEFCIDIDVKDTNRKDTMLPGCLKLTKPEKVDFGCFKLPLLDEDEDDVTIETDDDDDDDDDEEWETFFE